MKDCHDTEKTLLLTQFVVERMTDAVFWAKKDGSIVYVNEAACNKLGYSKEELLKLKVKDIDYPYNDTLWEERWDEYKSKKSVIFERQHLCKNGEIITVEVRSDFFQFEEEEYLCGIVREISERKKAELALKLSEERYRLIADNSNDVIWVMDFPALKFSYISPSVYNLTGFSVEEYLEKSIEEIITPDSTSFILEALNTNVKQFYEGNRASNQLVNEVQSICKDGSLIWIEISTAFIVDALGMITGILGVSRNIEQRKKTEALLQQANQQLQEINAEKDKFFSIIAHDLRSPFNALLGIVELLVEELPSLSQEEIHKFAVTIQKSFKNLYHLLDNLLEWSRMQRGITSFFPDYFPLKEKTVKALEVVMESADKKEISIIYDIPDNIIIYADRHMFDTITRNLVFNAIKFTRKGGTVIISALINSNQEIEISVRDNGIGMNSKILSSLFHFDKQANRPGTEGELSTGLGLIISRDFIEKHQGRIWTESQESSGSVFYFTFPIGKLKN